MKTVIILAHPNLNDSVANKVIVERLKKESDVEIRDLTALYPDFKIDAEAEQKALLAADNIVFQYPFYWYNVPGILKQWMDEVLTYGFAYGSTGDKLHGKNFVISTTIGGPQDSYTPEGFNTYPIPELLKPFMQTANLTGMKFIDPVYTHSMVYIPGVYNVKEEVEERAADHAERLVATLAALAK